jgi:hypothetical protein
MQRPPPVLSGVAVPLYVPFLLPPAGGGNVGIDPLGGIARLPSGGEPLGKTGVEPNGVLYITVGGPEPGMIVVHAASHNTTPKFARIRRHWGILRINPSSSDDWLNAGSCVVVAPADE